MLRSAFLVLVSLLPSALWAQYVSGTVVVLEAGGDYIAVAADSFRLGPGQGEVSHTACKIVKLSDQLVFAASGLSSRQSYAGSPFTDTWNAKDIARHEHAALANKHTDHLIQKLAAAYGENLAARINHDLTLEPDGALMSYVTRQGGGGAAIFAGFDDRHQRVIVEVTVRTLVAGARTVGYDIKVLPGDDTQETEVVGDTTIAQELAAGGTERSRDWRSAMLLLQTGLGLKDRLLAAAESVAEQTAKYDPEHVGGPIDLILVTRKRGVTWVRRKPECTLKSQAGKAQGCQR